MEQLTIAIFLCVVVKSIIDAIIAPIVKKYPNFGWWWLPYPTWVLGGLLAWVAGVNLFLAYLPSELAGRILTAILVGGGSKLIADVFGNETDKRQFYKWDLEDKIKLPPPPDPPFRPVPIPPPDPPIRPVPIMPASEPEG